MSINLHKALECPLTLATVDGTRQKTPKSKIMDIILDSLDYDDSTNNAPSNAVYVIDLIGNFHSLVKLPATFRRLARRIIFDITLCYKVVYFACDTYRKNSIKQTDQLARGQAEEYILRTPDIKIPPSFGQFLSNACNKE